MTELLRAAALRPAVHFTPRRNWMNDPNGLVWFDGRYHLFFQYNPNGNDWGDMSWGHATSVDLLTWTEHPVALPCREEEQVFSGSVVFDHDDSSGFAHGQTAALVAVYTSVAPDGRQAQALAVSSDAGLTWQPFAGNPVLDRRSNGFRDPKVFRAADRHGRLRWVMVAVEAEERRVLVYSSFDLREWTYESSFGPYGPDGVVWECPDLIPFDIDGDTGERRWVMLLSVNPVGQGADRDGSSMAYFVGRFDGHAFTADHPGRWERLDHGRDFYAGVTFSNLPGDRHLMLGWMGNWRYAADIPTAPWRGAMSLPRELALRRVDGEVRLTQTLPAEVLAGLRSHEAALEGAGEQTFEVRSGVPSLIDLEWRCTGMAVVGIESADAGESLVRITFDVAGETLRFERHDPRGVHPDFAFSRDVRSRLRDGRLRITIVVDGCVLEVFTEDGAVAISSLIMPDAAAGRWTAFARTKPS